VAHRLIRSETLDASNLHEQLAGDPRQAARTILTAAREGVLNAQILLGQILLDGRGIERDPALARLWFGFAAKRGDAMGRNMLGRCLEHGWGGAVDLPGAAAQYRLAMASGLDWALYNYAGLLAGGRGVAQDQQHAFALYLRAAQAGHGKSMNLVGRYLEEGLAGQPNPTAAYDWYRKSAEAGDFRGQFSYAAVLAAQGRTADALLWIERALLGGNLNFLRVSRQSLAMAPEPSIRAQSLKYHQRAAELGDASDLRALQHYQLSA
jgi:TPR repeat protein